jgi:hypothetical protein
MPGPEKQKRGLIYFYFAALRVFIEWIRLDQLAAG